MEWWLNLTDISGIDVFANIDSLIFAVIAVFLLYRFIIKPIKDFFGL